MWWLSSAWCGVSLVVFQIKLAADTIDKTVQRLQMHERRDVNLVSVPSTPVSMDTSLDLIERLV